MLCSSVSDPVLGSGKIQGVLKKSAFPPWGVPFWGVPKNFCLFPMGCTGQAYNPAKFQGVKKECQSIQWVVPALSLFCLEIT